MIALIELLLALLAALTGQTVQVPTATPETPYVAPVAVLEPAEELSAPVVPCQEDDPCWDCETMGNKTCGPMEAEDIGDVWEPNNWACDGITIGIESYVTTNGIVWSLSEGPCTSEVAEALR